MDEVRKISVRIQGKDYHISCAESEEYIQKLAYYVDRKMTQIAGSNPLLDKTMVAVLTSLNVADELLKAGETIERLRNSAGQQAGTQPYLPSNLKKRPESLEEIPTDVT